MKRQRKCHCGKKATVFRPADGAKWCDACSPYAKYEAILDASPAGVRSALLRGDWKVMDAPGPAVRAKRNRKPAKARNRQK